ncbi:hypothetical protein SDJN02_27268 [Cucurbita argyrosperma subsp. argyrosperma]|nr:hypothetical protein SDJN02_27268 [Cucurbita argyrosperma subsp. argyrosperma]
MEIDLFDSRGIKMQEPFLMPKRWRNCTLGEGLKSDEHDESPGSLTPEDDIRSLLRVQIAINKSSNGCGEIEMEISDWEPFEIADYDRRREISLWVPNWNRSELPNIDSCFQLFEKEDDDGSSSILALPSLSSREQQLLSLSPLLKQIINISKWFKLVPDETLDDSSSTVLMASGKYSNLNFNVSKRCEYETRYGVQVRSRKTQGLHGWASIKQSQCAVQGHHNIATPLGRKDKRETDGRTLTRNRSLVDVHSQLLHRSLVRGSDSKRTVGALSKAIGFQHLVKGFFRERVSSRQTVGTRSKRCKRERGENDDIKVG